jgi:hypothetical protein
MATIREINQAWKKTKKIKNRNPATWRKDDFGNILRYGSYGTEGEYGWEIDHIKPKAKGDYDQPKNLRALFWKKNREKSDKG